MSALGFKLVRLVAFVLPSLALLSSGSVRAQTPQSVHIQVQVRPTGGHHLADLELFRI
jgi:hypothetical protein